MVALYYYSSILFVVVVAVVLVLLLFVVVVDPRAPEELQLKRSTVSSPEYYTQSIIVEFLW